MKKTIAFLILVLSTISVNAEFTRAKCEKTLTHSGDILIQRDWDEDSRNCYISIHGMDITDLKYRDYYFDNSGQFLVFNSYGEGPNSTHTGMRSFYLLPIVNDYPDFSIEPNGDVLVETVSGHQILFDSKQLKIKQFINGSFTEKPLANNNKGGTEIKPKTGFWLDAGFKLGGMTTDNPKNSTKVFGAKSGQCTLKNTELFHYDLGDYYNPLLYTGRDLELFLQKRCNIQF
jgi:hypothetical protein